MTDNNRKFLIIAGGECACELMLDSVGRPFLEEASRDAFIIAADSGYDTALRLGLVPRLLVGDMDSIISAPEGVDTLRVKAEKDDTDTMLALSIALEQGAEQITVIGGGGGRADHWLSNIFMLESLSDRGVDAVLWDGLNRLRVLCDGEAALPDIGGYFGVLALTDCRVSLTGCKYPTENAPLTRTLPYAVSNEVVGDFATVKLAGKAIVTESRRV